MEKRFLPLFALLISPFVKMIKCEVLSVIFPVSYNSFANGPGLLLVALNFMSNGCPKRFLSSEIKGSPKRRKCCGEY